MNSDADNGEKEDPHTEWGPQDSVQLVYRWLNSMVYGRYYELVFMGIIMVYKPTYNWVGPG